MRQSHPTCANKCDPDAIFHSLAPYAVEVFRRFMLQSNLASSPGFPTLRFSPIICKRFPWGHGLFEDSLAFQYGQGIPQ
jgi:hypothetical protein